MPIIQQREKCETTLPFSSEAIRAAKAKHKASKIKRPGHCVACRKTAISFSRECLVKSGEALHSRSRLLRSLAYFSFHWDLDWSFWTKAAQSGWAIQKCPASTTELKCCTNIK